mmetsp:Transcript_13060/g.52113  ORF Transcript_13060/g.52113 Transcript_13060/m.52113 type:complete len:91 (+) Transcript_13060:207-479(+)
MRSCRPASVESSVSASASVNVVSASMRKVPPHAAEELSAAAAMQAATALGVIPVCSREMRGYWRSAATTLIASDRSLGGASPMTVLLSSC